MRASLIVERGEAIPRVHVLDPNLAAILGRSHHCTVILHDEHASRQHAKVYYQDLQWKIDDLETMNGTKIDEQPVQPSAVLKNGQEIVIGEIRIRFVEEEAMPEYGRLDAPLLVSSEEPRTSQQASESATTFQANELAAINRFVNGCIQDKEPQAVIRRLLDLVYRQTGADLAGFLSFDPDNPQPKQVVPESKLVDRDLSRQLNRLAREQGRTVWLGRDADKVDPTESLMPYRDALCVPLLGEGLPFGALHVYKTGRRFSPRDVDFCEVAAGYAAASLAQLRDRRRLTFENSRLRVQGVRSDELVGDGAAMRQLRALIQRAASCDATVLLHGETGAGKEPCASRIHNLSRRAAGSFIVCNCGAIPGNLLESELFGHVRGAFTGAIADREGLFEQADNGTLFLDEIGDMSLDCQVKVLRLIEGKVFRRVGGKEDIHTNVRIIAATHKDLEDEVRQGKFRHDLFYRLSVISIMVPPLREHREDIPALADHFFKRQAEAHGPRKKELSPAALRKLQEFAWPGNVRQLYAVLENASVMCDGDVIQDSDLRLASTSQEERPDILNLEELTIWAIRKALARMKGHMQNTAKLLGISREALRANMRKYGIDREGN
jgi:two-component system, NtrC family, response regulator HydG